VYPKDKEGPSEQYVATFLMFTMATCGLIANLTAIRIIWKSRSLHNCFGYILLLHASAEALVLCSFIFWAVPTTLFDRAISKTTLGIKIGQILMVFYYVTVYAQLFNAINRFFAIASPMAYRTWFSNENVKFILGGIMLCSLIHGILYFFPGCNFYYDGDEFGWVYDNTSCREIMAFYVDFVVGCVITGATMFIDTSTFFLILKSGLFTGKSNKDVKFFIQNFSTSVLYTVMLVMVEIVSGFNSSKWYVFWTVTFTWELCHTIDGSKEMNSTKRPVNSFSSTSGSAEEESNQKDQYIAACVIFIIGVCGLIANTTAIRIVWKSKNLHNCFGYLLLLHASAEAAVLCAFVFWAVPISFFDISLARSTLGFKVGQLLMVFYYATFYVQLFKAINRFFAIASPISYRKWFSVENAKFILLVIIVLSLLHGALYFLPGCNFYYDVNYLNWDYDETECYELLSVYIDLYVGCSIIGITMLIDTCTLCLIIKHRLLKGKSNVEVKFFIQAFTTSILYTAMMISDQVLSYLVDNDWYVFVTATFAWEMCHVVDGDRSLAKSTLGLKVGQAVMTFHYATLYIQLFKAINRSSAIASPINYRKWFSNERSKSVIIIIIIFSSLHVSNFMDTNITDNPLDSYFTTTPYPEEKFSENDQYIAVSIIFAVGVCGLIANMTVIRIIWKSKSLHNCFGYLLLLHASAEAMVLCAFVFWAIPVTLFDRSLAKSTLGLKVGQAVMIFYYATFYVQLFKAINRFLAIASPINYRKWFSNERSKFILLAIIVLSLIHGIPYFIPGCEFYYDGDYFVWSYNYNSCYDILSLYVDLIMGCSIMGVTMFIDGCTLFLIIKKQLFNSKSNREVSFFIQAFSTSILYTLMLIIVELVADINTSNWYIFGTETLTWEMCHAIDG
ncbi:hypothetical protein FO519_006619, partial [Halicephalobus sp. NKZ332]